MSRRVAAALLAGTAIGVAFDSMAPFIPSTNGRPQPVVNPSGPQRSDTGAALGALRAATVKVSARGCSGSMVGSGTWLAPRAERTGVLVTNSHVVNGATSVEIDRPGAKPLAVIDDRPDLDLAFAAAAGQRSGVPLGPADADPPVGEPVLLGGHAGGGPLSVLDGSIVNVVDGRSYGSAGPVLLVDRATTEGFSGGPVVDLEGRLVGVLRAHDRTTGLTVAVPISMVVDAARSAAMHRGQTVC